MDLNGALLDKDKYELELFGEEKDNGSISYGALEKANKGSLLIDQISDIRHIQKNNRFLTCPKKRGFLL